MTKKKKIIRIVIIAAVLLIVFIGGREIFYARMVTTNSIQIEMNGEDLVKNSESIIVGTVIKKLGTKRFIDESGEIMVSNHWQIKVDKDYKYLASGYIIVEIPGGRYGLTEVIAEDAPRLNEGEKVLLYLKGSKSVGEYEIVGQCQGKYTFSADKSGLEILIQDQTNTQKSVTELENEMKD